MNARLFLSATQTVERSMIAFALAFACVMTCSAQDGQAAQPKLEVRSVNGGNIEVFWDAQLSDFELSVTDSLTPGTIWIPTTVTSVIQGPNRVVRIEAGAEARFYRLQSSLSNAPSPDARDDIAVTAPGNQITISVTENDLNFAQGPLTVIAWSEPTNGTVAFSFSTATYTPRAGFVGNDSFSYTVQNSGGGTDTAAVYVSVGNSGGTPVVSRFAPASGMIGSEVLIEGNGFQPDPLKTSLQLGGVQVAFTQITPTSIRAVIPPGAVSGVFTVVTPDGQAQSSQPFAVIASRDFDLFSTPVDVSLQQGSSTTFAVYSQTVAGFSDLIHLQANNLPSGISAVFERPTLSGNQQSIVTLRAASNAPPGTTIISIAGTAQIDGRGITRSTETRVNLFAGGRTELLGRIKLLDGPPIEGVRFTLQGKTTLSDSAGNFRFVDAQTGTHTLSVDATPANPKYPIYGLDVTLIAGTNVTLAPFQICPPPPPERFTQITDTNVTRVVTDERFPGASITIPAGVRIVGWDGVPKTQLAIERLTPDQLPIPPPPFPTRTLYQPMFGTPMGGLPSQPLPVTIPNDLNLNPGEKVEVWYYESAPMVGVPARWVMAGLGTVSSDGLIIVSDPGVGIARFCGICGVMCANPRRDTQDNTNKNAPRAGDPVDLTLGQVVVDKTDLFLPGRFPAVIHRKYNPHEPFEIAGFDLGFGPGWSLSVDIVLEESSETLRRIVLPGNSRYSFVRQSDGSFRNDMADFKGAVLSPTPNSGHVLRFRDGRQWTFFSEPLLRGFGVLMEQTDRNGNRLTFERNLANRQSGRIQRIVEPSGRALTFSVRNDNKISEITDPIGRKVLYGYNQAGRLETVTDPAGGVTRYTYDGEGRILSITDARGITYITSEYGSDGRVSRQVQADGGVWLFEYIGAPGVTAETIVTDPRGFRTRHRFSPGGTLAEMIDPLGIKTSYERNSSDHITSIVDGLGRITRFEYDSGGNVTRITDPAGNSTLSEYEPVFNRITKLTDALGNVTTFEYDSRGNLVATVDPLQNLKPEPERLKTRITYNEFGQPVSYTDVLGNQTLFHYDYFGNVEKLTDPLANSAYRAYDLVSRLIAQTDARGRTTHFSYDELNRLIEVIDGMGGRTKLVYDPNGNLLRLTDALNHSTTYEYDNMDRVTARVDPLGARETFAYDPLGNLVSHIDRKGQVSSYRYNAMGRSLGATYADAETAFVYDAIGRLIQAADTAGGTITLNYDTLDRLIEETTTHGTIEYGYDALSRRTTMRVPGQESVRYRYDANSQLEQIVQGARIVDFDHDPLGRRTRLVLPNGVSTDYLYDAASRLTELIYRNTVAVLGNLTYEYDAVSGRAQMGGSFARLLLPDLVATATYDARNRQLAFGENSMGFDPNGNLTALQNSSGTTTFTWDARNRLKTLESPGITAAFTYDPFGRRSSKLINGRLTLNGYDGANIALEIGANRQGFLFSGSVDEPLAREGEEYFLTDALGSILAIADGSGSLKTEYSYEPFGETETRDIAGPSENLFQFTGRENDLTGYHFYRARYYSATLKRFLSEDPVGLFVGNFNLYGYADESPISKVDPFGLAEFRYRPLGGPLGKFGVKGNRTDDKLNTVIGHEQIFFDDGQSPSNIGFFNDNTLKEEADLSIYEASNDSGYDDAIMRKAVANVTPRPYQLLGFNQYNCQDWAAAVREEYHRLKRDADLERAEQPELGGRK